MREAKIVECKFIDGTDDDMYAVYLIENGEEKELRALPGKSIHYAEDVADNWVSGLINL